MENKIGNNVNKEHAFTTNKDNDDEDVEDEVEGMKINDDELNIVILTNDKNNNDDEEGEKEMEKLITASGKREPLM